MGAFRDETAAFLAERARLGRLTTYTELNAVLHERTGAPAFEFARDRDRAAMGDLLGQVAQQHLQEVGALLSAIVVYLNENDAGPGFYRLAIQLELLPVTPSSAAKLEFWTRQVAKVHAHYA